MVLAVFKAAKEMEFDKTSVVPVAIPWSTMFQIISLYSLTMLLANLSIIDYNSITL